MNPARILTFAVCLAVSLLSPTQAAEKTLKVKPSKVSMAKQREREKMFTKWMTERDLEALYEMKGKAREQMIYFEYHEGKEQYRAIFTKSVFLNDWAWRTISGEKEMELDVTSYKARGLEPLWVVLEGHFYSILFVPPSQLDAARKVVQDLGIEAPVVK